MAKCDEKLIADHRDVLIGDFQNLLDFDKDEGQDNLLPHKSTILTMHSAVDLQRMYALLSRIENGLEPLRHKFEEHVKNSGLAAVAKVLGEGSVDALVSFWITEL